MITLVFESSLSGHRLEYIHYIYMGAVNRPEEEFVFAVPENEWTSIKSKKTWPHSDNVRFLMLDANDCKKCKEGNLLVQSLKSARLIKQTALECKGNNILLISLAVAIPFLPLILPSQIKLSGIIYKIYLRAPKNGIRKLLDRFRYYIMAHNRSMGKVFILNDRKSVTSLNRIYHTDRFTFLPDPVPEVDIEKLIDLRSFLKISPDNKVFLHFGAMEERKGSLLILKAILSLNRECLSEKVFIFAGRIGVKIKDEFYRLVTQCEAKGAKIIVMDEFVSYEMLNNLCHTSDIILAPYLMTDLSSGVIGYAAVHNKPIVGPDSGLIGELIKDNDLGVTLTQITPDCIAKALKRQSVGYTNYGASDYTLKNSVSNFLATLLS